MLALLLTFQLGAALNKKVKDFVVLKRTASVLNWIPDSGIYNLILTRDSELDIKSWSTSLSTCSTL